MHTNPNTWNRIFTFCLGLLIGSAFCMKWMEGDLVQNGKLFTIIGLEISYPTEQVASILAGLDDRLKTILQYHLHFDYIFMVAVYPGIASLCMIGKAKSGSRIFGIILTLLAILQLVAWGCDIYENKCLLDWIKDPVIDDNFGLYHLIVALKWILALTGAAIGIFAAVRKSSKPATA